MASNFNALMDPAQLGQAVQNAFMQGAQTRALSNYARNPSMGAASDVTGLNPRLGMQLQDRETERQAAEQQAQQEAQAAELRRRAAAGDPAAKAELAGIDFSAWNALDDNQRTEIELRTDAVGQAALAVSQLPPQQQPQAWDAYVGQLAQRWPDLAQYQGKYSPEALQSAIAQAGMIKDALGLAEPKYMAIPPGGTLVNTRDPSAIAQFGGQQPQQPQVAPQAGGQAFTFEQYSGAVNGLGKAQADAWLQRNGFAVQVQTPEQARQLPSGTPIILPDGSQGRVP